jgi:hypothetical protein
MTLILIGLLVVPGCQGRSIRPDDETLPIPTGNTTATEPAGETSFGGTQPEASVSPSDETEPTTPLEPILLSVPAAGVTFELPGGWTLAQATRQIHTFTSPEKDAVLNVFVGVGHAPNVAAGQENMIFDYVDWRLRDMPVYYNGFEGWGSTLTLLASNFEVIDNIFTEGAATPAHVMDANLSVGMLDEYGKLAVCPDYPSIYYAYGIRETGTAVVFLLSKNPESAIDIQPIMDRIIESSVPYAGTLDDLDVTYTRFEFEDIGFSFELPSEYEALSYGDNVKLAIPADAANPLNDIQIIIFQNRPESSDPVDIAQYLVDSEFYQMFFDLENIPRGGSKNCWLAYTERSQGKFPYFLDNGVRAYWEGYFYFFQTINLSDEELLATPDNGHTTFCVVPMRNGSHRFYVLINAPGNAQSMVDSVLNHINETRTFF